MTKKKKDVINQKEERYGIFVNDQSNELDVDYGRQFIQKDNVHFVYLFKVNVVESKSHSLYGQAKAKDKVYSKPIKLNVMVDIEEPKQEQYGGSGLVRDDTGKLTFGVYLKELQERGVDIERGDIIRYNMSGEKNRYYEVEFANNVNDSPEYSFGGFYNYWKKIIAVPVKGDTLPIDDDMYDFDSYDRNSGTQQMDNSSVVWQEPVTRVPEAPLDGNQYGRQDGEWTIVIHPPQLQADWNQTGDTYVDYIKNKPFIIPEAPVDGSQYIRKDGDWQEVTIPDQFPEAPLDGNQYVRQDGDWQEVTIPDQFPEAPLDGNQYVRQDGDWSVITIPDQLQADWNQTGDTYVDYIKNKPFIIPEAPVDGSQYVRQNSDWSLITIPDQVQPDWNQTGTTQPDYIKNKPSLYKRFTDLDDVIPENYFGRAKNVPIVTDDETQLDLIETEELETVQAKFTHLSDVPQTYGGSAGNMVMVNGTEDGLVFLPVPQQQQADWTQTGSTSPSYIRHKPTIPVVKTSSGDTTSGYLTTKIIAGLNTTISENVDVSGNTISINSFLSEIPFEWCIHAGMIETFKLDRYSTNGYKILKAVLESDAIVNGVNININGIPVNGLNNLSITTTITVFNAIDTNIANIGDVVTITTIGDDSGTPTLIAGKIILG